MLANKLYTSTAHTGVCTHVYGLVTSTVEMTAKVRYFVHIFLFIIRYFRSEVAFGEYH